MAYDKEHRQDDLYKLQEKDMTNWIKELSKFSKASCEYGNNILMFYYKKERDVNKAKDICERRNISYFKDSIFNSSINLYRFEVLCWPQTLTPYKLRRDEKQDI